MGLFSPRINIRKLAPLCRQFATAHDAGIPIIQTFGLLKREMKDPGVRELLTRMEQVVRQGGTLSEAAHAETRYLPPYMVETITAGESGGKLDVMFTELADYFEDRLEMRRQITRAVAYPCFLLTSCWFLGTFALGLVNLIPASFKSGKNLDIWEYLSQYGKFQLTALLVAGAVAAVAIFLSRAGALRWITSAVTTHIWPLSAVTLRFGLARFFRSMALLINAGLPITQCIERAASVTANPYIERDLLQAVPLVQNGATLTEAFSGCRYMLPTAREMLRVGEISGKLDTQLRKVSQYYVQEASHAVDVALKAMGVFIILLVGGVIAYVVIKFYLSYFGGLMDAIG